MNKFPIHQGYIVSVGRTVWEVLGFVPQVCYCMIFPRQFNNGHENGKAGEEPGGGVGRGNILGTSRIPDPPFMGGEGISYA